MRNYVSDGKTINFTNTTGSPIPNGAVVPLADILGIAQSDIAIGDAGVLHLQGVFELPKVSGAVFAVGEKLLWDASAGAFDDSAATPAAGDVMGGAVAWAAGSAGQLVCLARLTPGNTGVAT